MKKDIFRVCILGLVGLTLFTGCNNKDKVEKIKKNEEAINYEEQIKEKEYYSVEYYKFKSKSTLLEEYNDVISMLTEYDADVSKVVTLTKEDNVYEAIITQDSENLVSVYYEYLLLIKNDKEFISVFQSSKNEDKTNMKEIGEKIKNSISSGKDFRTVFDDYAKENKLIVTSEGFYKSSMDNCETALNASNSEVVLYTGSNKKVETVDFDTIDLAAEKCKIIAVAKNSDGQVIWSFDVGIIPKYAGGPFINIEKGDKYVYYTIGNSLDILDIQTGKVIRTVEFDDLVAFNYLIEYKDKLFLIRGDMTSTDTLYVVDINNGKILKKINEFNIHDIIRKEKNIEIEENLSFDIKNVKKENDKIYLDVNTLDENGDKKDIIGTLTIDYNDYSIKYDEK